MADFFFYSTEIDPTLTPDEANPAPNDLVELDQPPTFGTYEADDTTPTRGAVLPTLGGVVVQDFGAVAEDGRIRLAEDKALTAATVTALAALAAAGSEVYFTDGFSCWRVAFARPSGFRAWKNLFWAQKGTMIYSYEINLVVVSKEI